MSVEAAILFPGMLLLVGLVIVLGQMVMAKQTVDGAAAQAARAASAERKVHSAIARARGTATTTLRESGVECLDLHIQVQAAGLTAPVGAPAKVAVTVECRAEFGITLPGLPASRTLRTTRTSPVDTYRSK